MIHNSILDTDLYKISMAQAVAQKFPYAQAQYKFINRQKGSMSFTEEMTNRLVNQINKMREFSLSDSEKNWLSLNCPYLTPVFLDFLKGYRYNPDEVFVARFGDELDIRIQGPWYRTIFWEVPLLSLISETYFEFQNVESKEADIQRQWDKAKRLNQLGIKFADFGTRRRFSFSHHCNVVCCLEDVRNFVGTSNVYLARLYGTKPIGTQAHEWIMFHGAKYGYREANHMAMKNWVDVFHGNLGVALTDTFTSDDFFRSFTSKYAKLFDGVRHDSGDPKVFADRVVDHYKRLGIDPKAKTIVFSDGLNVEKAEELHAYCSGRIRSSFGIGTNFSNDIDGVTPLNIVIKMTQCKPYGASNWLPVVKLSDDVGKHTGLEQEIDLCKKTLGIGE